MYKRRMKILFPTKKYKTLKHLIMNRGEFFELEKLLKILLMNWILKFLLMKIKAKNELWLKKKNEKTKV